MFVLFILRQFLNVAWAALTNGLLTSASQVQELPACV